MPIYEYECTMCGRRHELLTKWDVKWSYCDGADGNGCPEALAQGLVRSLAKRLEVSSSPPVALFRGGGFTRSSNGGRCR
jgi:putative FmdB family regulatory protein